MNIIVCVKGVHDYSDFPISVINNEISFRGAPLNINPPDCYAIEAALRMRELHGGTVTAISVGAEEAEIALRHALGMGVDTAYLISDPLLVDLDTQANAKLLTAGIHKLGNSNDIALVYFGRQSIEDNSSLVPAQTARLLGWQVFEHVSDLKLIEKAFRLKYSFDEGHQIVTTEPPVVVSISKDFLKDEPGDVDFDREDEVKQIEIPIWSISDLGISLPVPIVVRRGFLNPPKRDIPCEFITGNPDEIAENLVEKLQAGKVL